MNLTAVRREIQDHLESLRVKDAPYGTYLMLAGGRPELYATCDAAITRTVMGEDLLCTLSAQQRREWAAHINSFALPEGTYRDLPKSSGEWHSLEHRNGMTIGALGALGERQAYPVSLYAQFDTASKLDAWLERVDWRNFWSGSHLFWGGMHCFSLSRRCTREWREAAITWLNRNLDEQTGWWRKGVPHAGEARNRGFMALGGACHVWPIYQHLRLRFPCPRAVIDSILAMQQADGCWHSFANYMELDALYGLAYMRSLAPGYRRAEIEEAVARHGALIAAQYPSFLARNPDQHRILALVGTLGLLNQLDPEQYPDTVCWSDIFSDPRLYRTAEVEVLA